MEFSRRYGDFALASVAVRLRLVAGKIEGPVRIALGAAADRVIRARQGRSRGSRDASLRRRLSTRQRLKPPPRSIR